MVIKKSKDANTDIFEYMKETSNLSDKYTIQLLEPLKRDGTNIYESAIHLPELRIGQPKTRNALGRLIFESCTDEHWKKIFPALSFIELSTCDTYVQDDLIDEQPVRNGDAATWKKYGTYKAICAGNLQRHISIKALENLDICDSDMLRILNLANDMWLRLWTGEAFNEDMKEGTIFEQYINRCYNLSGIMYDTIAQIAAICAQKDEPDIKIASDIGRNYGIATMIRNDLADFLPEVSKHSKALSKSPYEDVRKGIWTYPISYAMQNSGTHEQEIIKSVLGSDYETIARSDLYNILKSCGAIDATLDLITDYKNEANQHISELPESMSRNLLFMLAESLENLRVMDKRHKKRYS